MDSPPKVGVPPGSNGHEESDANEGALTRLGVILLLLLGGVLVLMFGLLKLFEKYPPSQTTQVSSLAKQGALPSEPRLQAQPALDMATYRQWEDSMLTTYGWVDKEKGIVRVPIDSAIALVLRRGFPGVGEQFLSSK